MPEYPTDKMQVANKQHYGDTAQLIADMNELIARIKQLRICIALYLVSNDVENRKFP
ncbi:hypothetical protein Mic7113_4987 [Allocoleopsis franciscana PCC 7113]|uniref:Uncharacterized protein n=1 Tax=Allocoleopsis franciscana PCC 7113 TaxID=1173027 RepID=K9WKE6_9CYAN|nr:hypothetical protein Mic7113_4987 [Allocoleopsis franciscana PCC 7113]